MPRLEGFISRLRRSTPQVDQTATAVTTTPSDSQTPEVLEQWESPEVNTGERERWDAALLGPTFFKDGYEYVTTLALRSDPTKKVYALLKTNSLGAGIDIPLIDDTPDEKLVEDAYLRSTFFGDIDPGKYYGFATEPHSRNIFLAFLNRKIAGVPPKGVEQWFYDTYDMKHGEEFRSVYISSHGGSGTHNADIRARRREDEIRGVTTEDAIAYAQVVRKSLPHIDLNPIPIVSYLDDLQSALKFLPKDWDLAA